MQYPDISVGLSLEKEGENLLVRYVILIAVSLLLNLLAINNFFASLNTIKTNFNEPIQLSLVQLKNKTEPKIQPKKIIAPDSDIDEKVKNNEQPKLASKDSSVKEESLARGGGTDKEGERPMMEQKIAKLEEVTQQKINKSEKPDESHKVKEGINEVPAKMLKDEIKNEQKNDPKKEAKNEQKSSLSKSLFLTPQESASLFGEGPPAKKSGVPDLMPDIKDGKFTLLNTKANRFSVFVRRVGLRVFGILKSQTHPAMQLSGSGVVALKLTKAGDVFSCEVQENSGSVEFDRALIESTRRGGGDKNVPEEALGEDGLVTFVFTGRTYFRSEHNGGRSQWVEMGISLE